MTARHAWIAGFASLAALCGIISIAVIDQTGPAIVGVSGDAPTAAGWIATILPLLGTTGGIVGAIVAWLGKAAPLLGGTLGKLSAGVGGSHTAILSAIFAGLEVASGKPAKSEGSATINGGVLSWSFSFVPESNISPAAK